jgi:hypothetical protein
MKRLLAAVFLTLVLCVVGCGGSDSGGSPPPDTAGSQSDVTLGMQALANGDYSSANTYFRSAVGKDPSNGQAQFGLALTDVYLLNDDSQVQGAVGGFFARAGLRQATPLARHASAATQVAALRESVTGKYSPRNTAMAAMRMLAFAAEDPESLSKIQHIIKTVVMPRLAEAEIRLGIVEQASEFVMKFPPSVTNLPDTIEIDKGEVYLLDAVVNGVQGWLNIAVAYNFDVENSDYEHVDPESLLAPGTVFGTLNADGAIQLNAARTNFIFVNTRFDQAASFIASETDDQSDDLVPQEWLNTPEYDELTADVDRLYNTLIGPVSVDATDSNQQPFPLLLDLGKFFVPAIGDLKTVLPNHTFVNGDPVVDNPITFPDPTINGIFPDMTNARWQQLTGQNGAPTALVPNRRIALSSVRPRR